MSCFKVPFNLKDYKDILPDPEQYLKHDFFINGDEYQKGNIDNCIWSRKMPSIGEINSPQFREREARRILKTGAWICIKEEIIWLPPQYYFALQYGAAGSSDFQFRLKRLKNNYLQIQARNNPECLGTLTLKSRGDGETTMAIHDAFWECLDGNMDIGQIGIQSRSRDDSINPCWSYVQTLWQSLSKWIKDDLCSDFASGNNIAEKMIWQRAADEAIGVRARNVRFAYYPSGTPMDGKHDMKICMLDEVCKWLECSFYHVFTNYSKFILPGLERRGLFRMFSSPADTNCQSNQEVYDLWKDSNPAELTELGTTKSRIHRIYSNPLEGIHGAYDKWGDADSERIYKHIMMQRASKPKDKLLAEIRGFPLNEKEMFESADEGRVWDNYEGIKKRGIYLLGTRFKNEVTKEPVKVFGNLEWKDGVQDTEVVFRQADKISFDVNDARFAFSFLPQNKEPLINPFQPPKYVENCLGIDSWGKRHSKTKLPSNGAAVNFKFRDLFETGINKTFTMLYCNRPHQTIFNEDMIRAAVFTRAMVQYENLNDKVADHFEDRGYHAWLLPSDGQKKGSLLTGDAPSGKGAFLDEIIGLINAYTSLPYADQVEYLLNNVWFTELCDDWLSFNPADTHKSDISMAAGQAIFGATKMLHKKVRQKHSFNDSVLSYLLGD
jgi:hypothetical protein